MKQSSPYQPLFRVVQNIAEDIRETVHAQMRGAALHMVQSLFSEEVDRLCGARFSRKSEDQCHRTGSDPGSVIV